jgi:hypothetical protein
MKLGQGEGSLAQRRHGVGLGTERCGAGKGGGEGG